MPSKIKSYYTTDMDMKPIWSNNIKSIGEYDSECMTLVIEFNSGAIYKYYGIPEDIYIGMMKAPSQGVFFYHNIRQRFQSDIISAEIVQNSSKNKLDSTNSLFDIYPELQKLEKLDEKESKLRKEYKQGKVGFSEFDIALHTLSIERDKLCSRLEKKGYFGQELEQELGGSSTTDINFSGIVGSSINFLFDFTGVLVKNTFIILGMMLAVFVVMK